MANHVVVGTVSCETKDLFAALPQTVAVDINDLGTIKLSLEVTWKSVLSCVHLFTHSSFVHTKLLDFSEVALSPIPSNQKQILYMYVAMFDAFPVLLSLVFSSDSSLKCG